MRKIALGIVMAALASAPAMADPITGLFNTGVDSAGVSLTNGSPEIHYTLVSVPSGPTNLRVATSTNGFPIPPWLPDSSASAWIGPNSDGQLNGPVGVYDYSISFTLPVGADLATVSITGQWSTDNPGTDILVDGGSTSNASADYLAYTPFTLNASNATFTAGVNTLDFLITNTAFGPTGLRVEFLSATVDVPEPSTVLLTGFAMAVLGAARRRRRSV